MDGLTWITYVGVITALIVFPGPVALLCTSHGLKFGRHRATATVLGGGLASLVLMLVSALGLGAILAASETAFSLLKVVGGGYLIFLGIQAWRARPQPPSPELDGAAPDPLAPKASIGRLFRHGFMVGVSNPKDLLFFAALFPNFIAVGEPQLVQFAILALTWLVIDTTLMSIYAAMGSGLGRWFNRPGRVKAFNRATGGLFMVAGGSLVASGH